MAPRTWILCLKVKNYILTKQDLGMRNKKMRNHPKIPGVKSPHVFTVLKGDTLLKDAFPEGKPNHRR